MSAQSVIFGPEASVLDDDGDVATRVGAFATIRYQLTPQIPVRLTFNIGNQFVSGSSSSGTGDGKSRNGGEGIYGGTMVRFDY